MKAEVAARLRAALNQLPLGTTAGSRTAHSGPLSPDEVRDALKECTRAIGILLTDAEHRRRDVQDVVDLQAELRTALAVMPSDVVLPRVPEEDGPRWGYIAIVATALGGVVALHALEVGAIAFLLVTR